MTVRRMLAAFGEWSSAGVPLVLASVYETAGSTYSKAGAQMIINPDGDFHGMLSGGCLEGDLAARSRAVLESGEPQAVTYDLGQNDEELWGLGVGCDGLMRIFLQPLQSSSGYEPFASMAAALDGDHVQLAVIVVDSDTDQVRPGAALVRIDGEIVFSSLGDFPEQALLDASPATSSFGQVEAGGNCLHCLYVVLAPPPAILVLGAGLDAEPVVRFASELGWRVTIQDHRPAYVEAGDFAGAERVLCVPVANLAEHVDFGRFSAAIVMSHHLASDRSYLAQLSRTSVPYIGLLGPADRRRRLLDELGDASATLVERVHGPAGLDLGGRGPAAIALSIVAEVHGFLLGPRPG